MCINCRSKKGKHKEKQEKPDQDYNNSDLEKIHSISALDLYNFLKQKYNINERLEEIIQEIYKK